MTDEGSRDPIDARRAGTNLRRVEELLDELQALLRERGDGVRERWQRSLPFADYSVDRWEKARTLGFGEGSSIYDGSLVLHDVRVGRHTWIGPFTILDGSGGLVIGEHCSISAGVQIYTHDSVAHALSGGTEPIAYAPVTIGDRCYIGPNVVVSKGVTIGDGCVIGAQSLVNRDVPSGARAWGVPCRVQPEGPFGGGS
jgi:acetyltransferase-like isoleucine patch superfamily enzyme